MAKSRPRVMKSAVMAIWVALVPACPAAFAAASAATAPPAQAQVKAEQAWARATVAQQKASAAFMRLTSKVDARVVEVRTPVAGVARIHEMKLEGGVMRMRALSQLELPAGRAIEMRPDGAHVMLMDLKRPLKEGETVPLTLVVDIGGRRVPVEVAVKVRAPDAMPD
ncbi:MAG TPA: copper chaperone PCu(A)C [Burkholderiaceae bacterium]